MRAVKKKLFEEHKSPDKFVERLTRLLLLPSFLTLVILTIFSFLYIFSAHLPE